VAAETLPVRSGLARFGPFIATGGAIGLSLIAILAALHFGADLVTVAVDLPGGRASVDAVVVTLLALAGALVAIVVVARLSAGDGRRPAVAVAVGIVVLLAIRSAAAAGYDGVGDGELREYDELARGVFTGACCFADRPMGYPIMLALAYAGLGAGQTAVELLNIAFALVTGVLVWSLARRCYGDRVGAIALLLYGLWPAGALMVVTSMPHTSYELAIVAAAWAAICVRPGWRGSAATGLALGLAQWLRPSTPILMPVYLLARAWPGQTWRAFLGGTLLPMAGVALAVLVPVLGHNLAAHGEMSISTSSYGGHGLWIGTDQRSDGRYSQQASDEVLAMEGQDFWEQSGRAGQLAMARITADPLGTLLMGVRKQDTLWGTEHYGVQYAIRRASANDPSKPSATLAAITSGAYWLLVVAGAVGGLALRRRRTDALMMLVVGAVAAVAATHVLLEVRDRYHAFVVPLLLPLAAIAIVALLERLRLLPPDPPMAPAHAPAAAPVGDQQTAAMGGDAASGRPTIPPVGPDGPSRTLHLVHTLSIRVRSLPRPASS